MSGDEPTYEELVAPLDQKRGAYLAAMCTLELMVDTALLTFFQVPAFRRQQIARGSILAAAGLTAKADALDYIVRASKLSDQYGDFVTGVRRSSAYRNEVAHATVGWGVGAKTQHFVSFRFRRGRPESHTLTSRALDARIKEVHELTRDASALAKALAQLPSGDAGVLPFDEWK